MTPRTVPATASLPVPDRALAIGAHPDDIEFNCGATVARWTSKGCAVHILILTDGSKGSWEPGVDDAALAALRKGEARTAAGELGVPADQVHFLDLVDGELEYSPAVRNAVCRVIRSVRPGVVLGHDPWKRYRLHPDHRAAGFLTTDAVVAAREPAYTSGQSDPHHRADALLLFEADEPDHIEIADGFAHAKIAALLAHRSQYRSTMGIGTDPEDIARFAQWVEHDLAEKGSLAGVYTGEAFKLIADL